tara:strand:- start:28299 stop:28607 length:309 start_codon:yes stop_codon:yes gene_type:complete
MRNKYKAIKTKVDDITFDSKKEARRYVQLKLMVKAGAISELKLQPRFDLIINGCKCGFYKADFDYIENGKRVIEDVKGMKTPVYNLKKKLVKAIYGIDIFET